MKQTRKPNQSRRALTGTLLASPLLLSAAPAWAAPPGAGQMLKEIRPAPELPKAGLSAPGVEEPAVHETAGGARIHVQGLHITGQSIYTEAELLAIVHDGVNRDLSLAGLDALAERITRYYREHGYLVARAYVPAQEIRDGQVTIAVLEGRLGQVKVNNAAGLKGSALAPVSSLASGAVLRGDDIEKSLLPLSDLSGVQVKSVLKPGASIGTSDLLVDVEPGRALTGEVDLDSYGNRYIGDVRLGGSVYFNNPLKRGDQLSLRVQSSGTGMNYGLFGYQLPVGSCGTRVGAAWSQMHYKLGSDFSVLNADGDAGVGSVHLQHPFVRGRRENLYGQVRYETKRLVDRIGASSTRSDKTLDNWTVGVSGDRADALGGGGRTNFALDYTTGTVGLDTVSRNIDATTAQSSGRFGKINLTAERLQRLTQDTSLSLSFAGQWASKNLESSEKYTLGGSAGVRAYPEGEASADEVQLIRLELRWQVRGPWQLKGFYDDGHATLNRNPWAVGANTRHLAGMGVGASYASGNMSFDLMAAWKAGTGAPTSDTDRSLRLWLQAVRYF